MIDTLINTIRICLNLISLAVLFRVILSWIGVISPGLISPSHPIMSVILQITEPLLRPIRRALPQTGTVDFSPLVLMFSIIALKQIMDRI
jgi:YggT family protein